MDIIEFLQKHSSVKLVIPITTGKMDYEIKSLAGDTCKRIKGLWVRSGLNLGIDLDTNAAAYVLPVNDNAIRIQRSTDIRLVNEQLFQSSDIELRQDDRSVHEKIPMDLVKSFCHPMMGGFFPLDIDNRDFGKSKIFINNEKLIQVARPEGFEIIIFYEKK
jgi:hypothetical protein